MALQRHAVSQKHTCWMMSAWKADVVRTALLALSRNAPCCVALDPALTRLERAVHLSMSSSMGTTGISSRVAPPRWMREHIRRRCSV